MLFSHWQRHPHWRADDEGTRFRLEAQLDEPGLGIGARRSLVIDGVAAELLPFHPQPGLGGQLPGPGDGRTQPDVRLVRIDQLKRLFARIHMLPRLDEVFIHHSVKRGKDAASAQLLLNLAHLHPRQLIGQLSLLHVIARLVILALGGTLLLVQTIQALELGASVTQVAPLSGLFRTRLLQREAQSRAVQAQQLVPRLHPAAKLGYPLHPTAHFGAERRLLAARHRAADPDAAPASPWATSASVTILLCASAGSPPASSRAPTTILVKPCVIDELLAQARCRRACGMSVCSPNRRKAGNRIRVKRVLQLMPPTMTVASPR